MTKAEIIEKMAAGRALESFIDSIKKTLKKGNKVTLVGFETFSVSKRKARTGRNPRTGETIGIKAFKSPKFIAGRFFGVFSEAEFHTLFHHEYFGIKCI